jgi:hypothetical protein
VLRFKGLNDVNAPKQYFDLPNLMAGATAGELFIVARLKDFANYYNGLAHFGTGYGTIYQPSGLWNDFGTADLEFYPRSTDATFTSPHLLNTSISAAGGSILRLNAAETITLTGQTVSFRTDPALGIDRYSEAFNGDIAEVLVFDRVLTPAERTTLQTYLATKYGITALLLQPPPAPALSAFVTTSTSVALSWTLNPAAPNTTTTLERQTGGGAFAEIASVTTATAFTNLGLTAGTTYTYRAKAANAAGSSAYSVPVTVTMPAAVAGVPSSGQRLWLRADLGVVTDATGAITTWYDQSGAQKNATQLIPAARPALVPNAANGKPVVRFDGTDDILDLAPFLTGAAAGELLVIVKIPGFATRLDGLWSLGGADGALTETRDGVRTFTEDFGNTRRLTTNAPLALPTDFLLYHVTARDGDWTLRLNGQMQFSTVAGVVAFNADPKLGRGAGGYFLQGDIAEIIAYDRVLTAAERTFIGGYLGSKYAVAGVLADVTPPSVPTGVAVSGVRARSASLVWTPASDNVAVTAYRVFVNGVPVGQSASPSFALTGLVPESNYLVTITAQDAAGHTSAASAQVMFATPKGLAAPANLRAQGLSATAFALTWTAATGPVAGYDVFRNGVLVGSTTALSFSASELPSLPSYTLGVSARDAEGNSVPASPQVVVDLATLDLSTTNDGISNRWKLASGLSPTDPAVAGSDADGDGRTNLQEYQSGTDPNDYYDGTVPILTWVGSATQLDPDDAVSVVVTNASGTVLVNAPVVFTATGNTHRLRLGAGEPVADQVVVRTDIRGVAKVFLIPGAQ